MRNIRAGLAITVIIATGAAAHAAELVAPSSAPISQTIVTLAAGVDTTLGADPSRRYLCLMNIGTGLVTLGFGAPAIAGSGWALEAASSAGHQGGSMCWESATVVAGTLHAVSAAGSTVAVLEAH